MQAEIGVMQPQLRNTRGTGSWKRTAASPHRAYAGSKALPTPSFQYSDTYFRFLASRTVREHTVVILSRQACGNLLGQPRERDT